MCLFRRGKAEQALRDTIYKMYSDYSNAVRIVKSCETYEHIITCDKLINNLENKWLRMIERLDCSLVQHNDLWSLQHISVVELNDLRRKVATEIIRKGFFNGEETT